MEISKPCCRTLLATIVACLAVVPTTGQCGGFAISAQSASATGNALSSAASAEDASVIWYNPAGMSYLTHAQIATVGNVVRTSFKFRDTGSSGVFSNPGTGEGGDGGGTAVVPQLYALYPLGNEFRVGLGLNVPFGLKTEYDAGWRGQLTALRSETKSLNINPSLSYHPAGPFSYGVGIDIQRFSATLTSSAGPLGVAKLDADDTSYGYNVGMMANVGASTRIGISYRSAIRYKLKGQSTFSLGGGLLDNAVRAALTVPENISVHVATMWLEPVELTASLVWTRWSRVDSLAVIRTSSSLSGAEGSAVAQLPFNWKDTLMAAAGATYNANTWKLRVGVAHDPAASNDIDRTPRLPDESRWFLTAGARFHFFGDIDIGISHDLINDATVDNASAAPGRLRGKFKSEADVFSVQYTYAF